MPLLTLKRKPDCITTAERPTHWNRKKGETNRRRNANNYNQQYFWHRCDNSPVESSESFTFPLFLYFSDDFVRSSLAKQRAYDFRALFPFHFHYDLLKVDRYFSMTRCSRFAPYFPRNLVSRDRVTSNAEKLDCSSLDAALNGSLSVALSMASCGGRS